MMIENSRSSFIPKRVEGAIPGRIKRRKTFNVFGFLSTALVIGSLLLAVGVFVLNQYTNDQLAKTQVEFTQKASRFNEQEIAEIREFDRRLRAARLLMSHHISPSKIFAALESNTKVSVQITNFSFTHDPGLEALLDVQGVTKTFTTLALQEQEFDSDNILSTILFSQLGTEVEKGDKDANSETEKGISGINFTFTGNLGLDTISYDKPTGGAVTQQQRVIATTSVESKVSTSSVVSGSSVTNE